MADWDYVLLKPAQRYLKRMPIEDQVRVIEVLDQLRQDATGLDVKLLKGRPELRLRVGKYRVLYVKDLENQVYVVTTIAPRGDVYK